MTVDRLLTIALESQNLIEAVLILSLDGYASRIHPHIGHSTDNSAQNTKKVLRCITCQQVDLVLLQSGLLYELKCKSSDSWIFLRFEPPQKWRIC